MLPNSRTANKAQADRIQERQPGGYKAQDNSSNNSHHYDFLEHQRFSQHKQRRDGPLRVKRIDRALTQRPHQHAIAALSLNQTDQQASSRGGKRGTEKETTQQSKETREKPTTGQSNPTKRGGRGTKEVRRPGTANEEMGFQPG